MSDYKSLGRSRLIAEIERLESFKAACMEWSDKTEWVQESAHWSELGKHRADVIKDRLEALKTENESMRKALISLKEHDRATCTQLEIIGAALNRSQENH